MDYQIACRCKQCQNERHKARAMKYPGMPGHDTPCLCGLCRIWRRSEEIKEKQAAFQD